MLRRIPDEEDGHYRYISLTVFVTVTISLIGVILSLVSYQIGQSAERDKLADRLTKQETDMVQAAVGPLVSRIVALEAGQLRQDAAMASIQAQVYRNTGILDSIQAHIK